MYHDKVTWILLAITVVCFTGAAIINVHNLLVAQGMANPWRFW